MAQTTTTTETTVAHLALQPTKYRTSHVPNHDFVPPKDFKFTANMVEVPLNPLGSTEIPRATFGNYGKENYKYHEYLPYHTLTSEAPLTPYDHVDVAARADPDKKALFSVMGERKDMTPNIGTEVRGVQLSLLTDQQKDELALYVAERGLVVFRDQDFVETGPQWLRDYGSYFGRLHVHQWAVHPKDCPELTVVFRDNDTGNFFDNALKGSLNTVKWHSDMSFERNPPGTTFLSSLDGPECGGDTLYMNCMTAYDRLSPTMQRICENLQAVHSVARQARTASKTNINRREPIDTVHPVVRKHPVTGRKALWVNAEFTTEIVGLRKEESDALLTMLFDHMHKGLDFQTRVRWENGTVVVYDNRMVQHSVTMDYPIGDGTRRHLVRVTPQGEVPSI
ncbi:hypothetical protein V1525DRAFT_415617 [Lipomyces kononenkoae]|uniref:Uncharacterized protein n=1 Tax=Lipomyces kononenkoae TaxID=34357 RepID=A0ACC3SPX9_LIPKO